MFRIVPIIARKMIDRYCALPHADLETDELLLAFRHRVDQYQHAFAVIFHASLQEDAVGPHVDVPPRQQIALLPVLVLALPLGRQPGNRRWRQVRRVLAQQGRQGLPGNRRSRCRPVEHRQQRIQTSGPPRPQRQDCRAEPDPLA